jgi:hypothetical protein
MPVGDIVGDPVGEYVGSGVGTGVGSTVGANVTIVTSSGSISTVACGPMIFFKTASAATSAAKLPLFTTDSSISPVVSAFRENNKSIPVAACFWITTVSPLLASSCMMLSANDGLDIPAAMPLVSADTVSTLMGISKLLPSNLRR